MRCPRAPPWLAAELVVRSIATSRGQCFEQLHGLFPFGLAGAQMATIASIVAFIDLAAPGVPAAEQRFDGGNHTVLELGAAFERNGPARLTTGIDAPTRSVARIEHQHASI